jgi:hydroxyethylthiazole kinase-like uncharacterized protein yjeF
MKILNSDQVKALDAYTIKNRPIASIDLMEHAAWQCTNWLIQNYGHVNGFYVFCGRGNNGGDGLAIVRQLSDQGIVAKALVLDGDKPGSPDFETNLARLEEEHAKPVMLRSTSDLPDFREDYAIVDALIGSGLKQPVHGLAAELIALLNNTPLPIVAVDVPSGLFTESNVNNNYATIVNADHTLSLELPKLAFFHPRNHEVVGCWHILPIGLSQDFIEQVDTPYTYLTASIVAKIHKTRPKFSHKGSFGHVKMIAGGLGKMGAAHISAKAALKAGAGLVTAHIPQVGSTVLQTSVPEVMVEHNSGKTNLEGTVDLEGYTIGIGPGIGTQEATALFVSEVIKKAKNPVVLDADALNILSRNKLWLADLPQHSILTPHPKEFSRLVGDWHSESEKLHKLITFCTEMKCILILKGAHTIIGNADGLLWFNSTGNPGMATAGSGDALTGIITGLLAQGYEPLDAARLGVYVHGLAGDLALEEESMESLTTSDILRFLGKAFNTLKDDIG